MKAIKTIFKNFYIIGLLYPIYWMITNDVIVIQEPNISDWFGDYNMPVADFVNLLVVTTFISLLFRKTIRELLKNTWVVGLLYPIYWLLTNEYISYQPDWSHWAGSNNFPTFLVISLWIGSFIISMIFRTKEERDKLCDLWEGKAKELP